MSASIITDSTGLTLGPDGPADQNSGQFEVGFAKCDCCGLTEECTPSYIQNIRDRYGGKWICGLCGEAVEDEILRCQKLISPDEALARHFTFCGKFRASSRPQDPTVDMIQAIRRVMRKSLESPKSPRSMPNSPMTKLRKVEHERYYDGRKLHSKFSPS